MSEENKRLAILDELDKFNTAPEADSLMLGILKEEEAAANRSNDYDRSAGDREDRSVEAPEDKVVEKERSLPNDYLPLNTSIQDLNSRFEGRFSGLERSLQSLAQSIAQSGQQRQQPVEQTYDPDMPVTGQQMQVLAQRQQMAYDMGLKAYKNNLSTKAHLEYQRFKSSNPDFQMDPQQLDYAIDAMARDDKLEQLEGTNWRGHFEQMYAPQRTARHESLQKEVDTLKKELETLKKASVRSAQPPEPVSPATGRSSRSPAAIATPLGASADDQIVGLKSFRQKGNFKGFGKDIKSIIQRGA